MDHFAGIDVSVKEASGCVLNETRSVVREVKVASEPDALLAVQARPCERHRHCNGGKPESA
jgi:transposase